MKSNLIQSNINTNNNNNKKEVKSSSLEEKGDRKWQPVSARLTTDSIPQPDSRYNVTLGCGRNYLHIISPFFLFFFEIHFPIRWEKYSNIQIHPNSSKFIQIHPKKRKMSFLFPSFDPGVRMLSIFISGHVASQFAYKDPEIGVGVGGWWCRAGALDGATVELPSNRSNLIDSRSRRHRSVSDRRINRYFIIIKFISLPSPPPSFRSVSDIESGSFAYDAQLFKSSHLGRWKRFRNNFE